MNEINNILNTTVYLWEDRVNLSILGICFDINYDFFILLTTLNNMRKFTLIYERYEHYFKIIVLYIKPTTYIL